MKFFQLIILILIGNHLLAQKCTFTFSGKVYDPHENSGLEFVNLYFEETGRYTQTDSTGYFLFENLCPGTFHLTINHLGCETKKVFFNLLGDSIANFELEHHEHFLQTVTVQSHRANSASQTQNTINSNEISRLAGSSLGQIVQQITGVSSVKNGSTISKPVIHGMSGNRIGILNNGIALAGQQWGTDHAPEIDPFASDHITVIKGVDALAYGGNNLGGLVLLEHGKIGKDPHLHSHNLFSYQGNGNQFALSSRLEQSKKKFDWRLTAGYKISGDHKTPGYYLTNTGSREYTGSFLIIKDFSPGKNTKHFLSIYHTELGILRGAHIGNLTDLKTAIGRDTPFFTKNDFSYSIESPFQKVSHYFYKGTHQLQKGKQFTEWSYAAQLNHRREYDVRRGNLSKTPALDLLMQSYFTEIKKKIELGNKNIFFGIQQKFNYNFNQPGTGIFPLIPNYLFNNSGAFIQGSYQVSNTLLELGSRYDFNLLSVNTFASRVPRIEEVKNHSFHNVSIATGVKQRLIEGWTARLNTGFTSRSPEVNELYSSGLHQAVAGIEEGNPMLSKEFSLKTILTNTFNLREDLIFETSLFAQRINNYIYLEPQNEYRLTIRGAFPVFKYNQTDANIYGIDALSRFEFFRHWQWLGQFSYIKMIDLVKDQALVNTPPVQLFSSVKYQQEKIPFFGFISAEMNARYVFRRSDIKDDQDFMSTPSGYCLLGAEITSDFSISNHKVKFAIRCENLLNVVYRDYLNRLRYFANEEGRNLAISLKFDL
ncbi:MAG: TonB-dependent receptor [Saprospiraceae bacterium]|nr:TonB-dependent receptor [Candidatus Vicinibacter affinis]